MKDIKDRQNEGIGISNLLSFCLDAVQGHMNWTPNKTRTHSCRFASQVR